MIDKQLFKKAIVYFLLGSFTIVIALAWNNAFTALIQTYLPNKEHNIVGQFTYALTLTIIFIVISSLFIERSTFELFISK